MQNSDKNILNNLNLKQIKETTYAIAMNSQGFLQPIDMTIEWNMSRNYPQIYAEVVTEKSSMILESELQIALGGKGHRPTPIQYFLYGIGSSYLSTIVFMLTKKGVRISQAKLKLKAEIDYSGFLTESTVEEPIKTLYLSLIIKCDINKDELTKLIDEARSKCLVFNPIKVEISLEE
jgi:uncharacterized OsmC-like protein